MSGQERKADTILTTISVMAADAKNILAMADQTQEAAELTEEQFHYLMLGLNPLEPRIKNVGPHRIS